jgi:hypothetical protein
LRYFSIEFIGSLHKRKGSTGELGGGNNPGEARKTRIFLFALVPGGINGTKRKTTITHHFDCIVTKFSY